MIRLAPFKPADFDLFISWLTDEDLVITIAGTCFSYPVTTDQLQRYLADEKSIAFNIIDSTQDKNIGHAEIITTGKDTFKLDKVIVGDKTNRGKGTGLLLINALLDYCFEKLHASEVELNVYDWNIAGIKCYEKAGFVFTGKTMTTNVRDNIWTAKNMTIDRERWTKNSSASISPERTTGG